MYVDICMCVYTGVMPIYTWVCLFGSTSVFMCVCGCIYVYHYLFGCVYMLVCVCVYVHICAVVYPYCTSKKILKATKRAPSPDPSERIRPACG